MDFNLVSTVFILSKPGCHKMHSVLFRSVPIRKHAVVNVPAVHFGFCVIAVAVLRTGHAFLSGDDVPRLVPKHLSAFAGIDALYVDLQSFARRLCDPRFAALKGSPLEVCLITDKFLRVQIEIINLNSVRTALPDNRPMMAFYLSISDLRFKPAALTAVVVGGIE